MKSIRCLLWIIALILPTVSIAKTSFAVAPGRLYFDLNHPKTQSFLIRNNGDKLVHLRIHPTFLPIASRSLHAGLSLITAKEKKTSLTPYILISPPVLSLRPGEQRDVRVSIRPSAHLNPGTYRAHLIVHMLEIFHQHHSKHVIQHGSVGMNLNFLMEIAVAIYANKGQGSVKLTTACHLNNKKQLVINVTNRTPWNFAGKTTLYKKNGTQKKIASKEIVIYRDSIKEIKFDHISKNIKNVIIKWKSESTQASIIETHCHIHASE
jgi:P pilus assembly chaperone PapD